MRAMILAAGLGTRLRPLTHSIPKALVSVMGRPLIAYPLLFLKSQGIKEVVINLHHLGEKIRETLGNGSSYGMRIFYSPEDPLLDTGGGIKQAQSLLEGETFLVLNCDTIIDLSLDAVLDFHRRSQATATMVLRQDPNATCYGVIETDQHHRIRRFLGTPAEVSYALQPWMFTGLHIMEPRVFSFMPATRPFSSTRETYPQMLLAGEPLFGFAHSGSWLVVDSAEGLAQAEEKIHKGAIRLSYLR